MPVSIALPDDLRAQVDQSSVTLFSLADGCLFVQALGQVAQDMDETQVLTVIILERHLHPAGPEAAAILAHMPAFVHRRTIACRGCHFLFWHSAGHVFLHVESRGVAADRGVRLPAEDAFGALVPAGDEALGVGGENRVIDCAVDDLSVSLVGFTAATQLQQGHDLTAQCLQMGALALRQLPRLAVQNT